MKLSIPPYVKKVMDVLLNQGFEAYVVGGAVRDMLLGRVPDDYDVVTNARPEEIKAVAATADIPVVSELGQNFGVVILRVDRHGVEGRPRSGTAIPWKKTWDAGILPSMPWQWTKMGRSPTASTDWMTFGAGSSGQWAMRTSGFQKMPCGCSGLAGSWPSWGSLLMQGSCRPSVIIWKRYGGFPWNG